MKKPCPLCMSLRARFVRWLGITLGVMEPKKEKPVEQTGFTQDQIAAIIGQKELELIALRMQLGAAMKRIEELGPKADKTGLEVVK